MNPSKLAAIILLVLCPWLHADDGKGKPLRGFTAVKVVVDCKGPGTPGEREMQAAVEAFLRKQGITVTRDDGFGVVWMRLSIETIKQENGTLSNTINVRGTDPVVTSTGRRVVASIWEKGSYGYVGAMRTKEMLKAAIDHVTVFASDFVSDNQD